MSGMMQIVAVKTTLSENLQLSYLISYPFRVIMQYKTIWNEDHKKLGHKFESQLVNAVLAPLTLYSCFKKTSYADTMIKLAAIWSVLNGLMSLSPQSGCEGYGEEATDEATTKNNATFLMDGKRHGERRARGLNYEEKYYTGLIDVLLQYVLVVYSDHQRSMGNVPTMESAGKCV
jgi:hypothetical protein